MDEDFCFSLCAPGLETALVASFSFEVCELGIWHLNFVLDFASPEYFRLKPYVVIVSTAPVRVDAYAHRFACV